MELLQQFEENFNRLLVAYETLQNEYNALQQKYEHQWEELLQTREQLSKLQKQYNALSTAAALTGDTEEKQMARQKIGKMIKMIDEALNSLSE
ncbi:MAG: hypothetical protein ACI3Z5_01060 [Paludibacteraceae bacterium]